jgi:hypothetical protein
MTKKGRSLKLRPEEKQEGVFDKLFALSFGEAVCTVEPIQMFRLDKVKACFLVAL